MGPSRAALSLNHTLRSFPLTRAKAIVALFERRWGRPAKRDATLPFKAPATSYGRAAVTPTPAKIACRITVMRPGRELQTRRPLKNKKLGT